MNKTLIKLYDLYFFIIPIERQNETNKRAFIMKKIVLLVVPFCNRSTLDLRYLVLEYCEGMDLEKAMKQFGMFPSALNEFEKYGP